MRWEGGKEPVCEQEQLKFMLISVWTLTAPLSEHAPSFFVQKKSVYSLEASRVREDSSTLWSAHTGSAGYLVRAVWLPNRSTRVQELHDADVCS